MLNAEAREALTRLVHRYHSALPSKRRDLVAAYEAAKAGNWSADSLGAFKMLCHRLAGSAASYGFASMGDAARELDQSLLFIQEDKQSAPATILPGRFTALCEAIDRAIDRPPPGDPSAPSDSATTGLSELPTVMVVDQDREIVEVLTRQLMSLGFTVLGYTDFGTALEAINKQSPSAVLIGVKFDGHERAAFDLGAAVLERADTQPGLIFMSDRSGLDERKAALGAQADGFFAKPLQFPPLVRMLERFSMPSEALRERVALVDDDPQTLALYAGRLRSEGMDVLEVSTPEPLLDQLLDFRPDAVLMDVEMPALDGVTLTAILRQHESLFDLPVLFLTSVEDETVHRQALRAGGDAVLRKSDSFDLMLTVLRNRISRYRRASASLRIDTLTRALNRAALMELMNFELQRAQRTQQAFSVVVFDVDGFGGINAQFGRSAGDLVLQRVTEIIRNRLRHVDVVGRYGADEIMVVMPGTKRTSAEAVARELVAQIGEQVMRFEGKLVPVGVTSAVIESRLDKHDSTHYAIQQLLVAVDETMGAAKQAGHGTTLSSVHWLRREPVAVPQ